MIVLRRCGIHMHTHNGILILLNHKNNEILPSAEIWLDLGQMVLGEISQRNTVCYHLYVESTKQTE